MRKDVQLRLERMRQDYAAVTGSPFRYFYCPVLFRDEEVPLCRGHVVNRAFTGSSGTWTVQREDVDDFFGSKFEADFSVLRHRGQTAGPDVLVDCTLRASLKPKIKSGGAEVQHFVARGPIPKEFTPVGVEDSRRPKVLGLKMTPAEVEAAEETEWTIEISRDLRVPSFVSLIKAAYLTKVHLLGYRYVLSAGGHLVGHDLLGSLFKASAGKSREDAQSWAREHLGEFAAMVRPVVENPFSFTGTVSDRRFLICWSTSGFPWATVVFVRTGDSLHAVMLPLSDEVEAIATFLSFLKNENESIAMKLACHTRHGTGGRWELSAEVLRMHWIKRGDVSFQ